jgi:two-component system sensor histidine kinase BaeS
MGRRHGPGPRIGCFVVSVLLSAALVGGLVLWVIASIFGAIAGATGSPLGIALAVASLLLLLVILGGIARRVAAPAGDLVDAAERIEAGDLAARVRERGPRETRSLARAFNAMAARLQADEARRRSFLADAAHELRTPLTVIRGRTEAMIDGVYPADPEHLAVILDETRTLERLVDDLRTVALLEAGALTLAREPTDPGALATDAVAAFRAQSEAAGIELRSSIAAGSPLVDADPVRIREVLANLIANALRHTPAGGSVTVAVEAAGAGLVRLSVSDTGAGMTPDIAGRAFDRFAKDPGSTGSGLGLAIARDLVEAHGGTIALDSQPGQGTTVSFEVPVSRA